MLTRGVGGLAAPEYYILFDELDLALCVQLQLVVKEYPLKAVCTLKKKKKERRKLFLSVKTNLGAYGPFQVQFNSL